MVTPSAAMVRTTSNTLSTINGARPIDGSSSSSRRGRAIMARPIATICCSPPDSVPAAWRRRSAKRGNSVNTRSVSWRTCAASRRT
ncbi:Protein of uncharacterised function (DUF1602) [Bordetella pertussis]|nr:Protein of uncharacterised function (DUF1602) [Bordetella pertussis]